MSQFDLVNKKAGLVPIHEQVLFSESIKCSKQMTFMNKFLLVNQKNVAQPVAIHKQMHTCQFFLVIHWNAAWPVQIHETTMRYLLFFLINHWNGDSQTIFLYFQSFKHLIISTDFCGWIQHQIIWCYKYKNTFPWWDLFGNNHYFHKYIMWCCCWHRNDSLYLCRNNSSGKQEFSL